MYSFENNMRTDDRPFWLCSYTPGIMFPIILPLGLILRGKTWKLLEVKRTREKTQGGYDRKIKIKVSQKYIVSNPSSATHILYNF